MIIHSFPGEIPRTRTNVHLGQDRRGYYEDTAINDNATHTTKNLKGWEFCIVIFRHAPLRSRVPRTLYIYSTAPEEDYGCQRQEWKRKRDDGVAGFLGKQAITGT